MNIQIAKVYEECLNPNFNNIILASGRLSGKSKTSALIACLLLLSNTNCDGIVARATYGSISQSIYSEFEAILSEVASNLFKFRKNPLSIINMLNSNTIYFTGLAGSGDRTKGIKTAHDVKFVIIEETQELKDRMNLDQALASFRRNFGDDVKVFILGNPPSFKAHWFNLFVEECKHDTTYLVKKTTYLDILPFINDFDLREIQKMKRIDEAKYKWLYLGEPVGSFGAVYPMFKQEMKISNNELLILRNRFRAVALIIGVDGAVNNDATCFTPMLLFENGQSIVLDIFYHDPKVNQVIGSHILVKDYVKKWFDELIKHYNLGTLEEQRNNIYGYAQILPIYMRIDSAATDLIQECQFYFGDRCDVSSVKKGSIVDMVSGVQSALSNEFIYFLDTGGYFNYFKNEFIKCDNPLTNQLELLIWNEKQNGYDPTVPNDASDAFTYAVRTWYANIENKTFFENLRKRKETSENFKSIINH